jgi:hypothetical protein
MNLVAIRELFLANLRELLSEQFREQGKSAKPLSQRQLQLRLPFGQPGTES